MANEKILKALKTLRESSKQRKFPQTVDLIINLKEIDMKKPESKINDEFILPNGKGEESKVSVFSDTHKIDGFEVYTSADIEKFSKNKRMARKVAQKSDFIYAEPKLMALVGKTFGQFIGPKGKIPKVIAGDPSAILKGLKRAVRIRIKDAPVVQFPVGKETMTDEQISQNIEESIKHLQAKLPGGKSNIGEILLKMTMSKPVKVEM